MSRNSLICQRSSRLGRSFLFWHRSNAQVALQQSPILQSDMDKVIKMSYNRKSKLVLRSVLRSESLRPFTQLVEHTLNSHYRLLNYASKIPKSGNIYEHKKLASLLPSSVTNSMFLYHVIPIVPAHSKRILPFYIRQRISRASAHEITQ